MRRAVIRLEGDEVPEVRGALAPEGGRDLPRARVSLSGAGTALTITIEADDTASLRAAMNSTLRWAEIAAGVSREAGR
jgi:tRNA threonylcarbamoyladenosine modification (KEOPS) complex  Pcc1 subunit